MTGTVWFMVKLVAGQYGAYFVDCSSMFSKANLKLWCRDGLHLSENQGLPLLLKRVHTATVSLLYEARATANPAGNMFIHIISQTDSPLRYQIFILQVLNSSLKEPKLIKDEVDPAEKTQYSKVANDINHGTPDSPSGDFETNASIDRTTPKMPNEAISEVDMSQSTSFNQMLYQLDFVMLTLPQVSLCFLAIPKRNCVPRKDSKLGNIRKNGD